MSFIEKITLIIILFLISLTAVNAEDSMDNTIKMKINDNVFDVKLENNSATNELIKYLEKGNITVNASDYSGFEKVGLLGFSLPTNDENINTKPGDIMLYQGDQISLFYNPHSWSYTKLGKIKNKTDDEIKEILGNGNIDIIFYIEKD